MDILYNHDVLIYEILPLLTPKDIYALIKTCNKNSYLKSHLYTKIINNIVVRLQHILKESYDGFIHLLEKTNAVISGSFLIQCILEERWTDEIDILIGYDKAIIDNNQTTYVAYDDVFRKNKLIEFFYNKKLIKKCFQNDLYQSIYVDHIIGPVYGYSTNDFEASIIFVPLEEEITQTNINKYINNYFDINICKNAFYVSDGIFHLDINIIDHIFNRYASFNYSKSFKLAMAHVNKYINRGFMFDNINTNEYYYDVNDKKWHIELHVKKSDKEIEIELPIWCFHHHADHYEWLASSSDGTVYEVTSGNIKIFEELTRYTDYLDVENNLIIIGNEIKPYCDNPYTLYRFDENHINTSFRTGILLYDVNYVCDVIIDNAN